jgi:long-chain acyl-CoA synthetase
VNPLYTPRELGTSSRTLAQAIVIIDFAHARCIANTPLKHVVLLRHGDQLEPAQGHSSAYVVLISENGASVCPNACSFNDAVSKASGDPETPATQPNDVAVIAVTPTAPPA